MSVLSFIVSVLALGLSFASFRIARSAFRSSHRPLVRAVGSFSPQVGVLGQDLTPRVLQMDRTILKNIGRAPALTVVACDPVPPTRN